MAKVQRIERAENTLKLNYQYAYLPLAILHNFMVDMKQDLQEVWRTGLIVKNKFIDAEAILWSSENTLKIIVLGEGRHKRDYLSIIRFFLDKINTHRNIESEIFVPLPKQENRTVKYIILSKLEKKGRKVYEDIEDDKEYNVSELLSGIASQEDIQAQAQVINYFYNYKIKNKGNNNQFFQGIHNSQIENQLQNKSQEEVKEFLYKKFMNEFEKLHNRHDSHDTNFEILKNQVLNLEDEFKSTLSEQSQKDFAEIQALILEQGNDLAHGIVTALADYIDNSEEIMKEHIDTELLQTYQKLTKKKEDWKLKVKLAIPLINLLGIEIGTDFEYDLNSKVKGLGRKLKAIFKKK